MEFEYDPVKSAVNLDKHGIDFETAQRLWDDECLVQLLSNKIGEKRFLAIGNVENKMWTAVCTYRNGKIRVISVRRARKKEIDYYDSQKN